MGARPYAPLLGRFLSVDPLEGGSANDYDYTNADPINHTDLDGLWSCRWCKKVWKATKKKFTSARRVAKVASKHVARKVAAGAKFTARRAVSAALATWRGGVAVSRWKVTRFAVRVVKVHRVLFTACYVYRAVRDTDSSWRDEFHDLWGCFNPGGNFAE